MIQQAEILEREMAARIPRFDITRSAGAIRSAAIADLPLARAALTTWLELSSCGIDQARTPLDQWRALLASATVQTRARLPRWMTHCDQHAEGIIHESLLCPQAIREARQAVVEGDVEMARQCLMRYPDSYCAAVAVMVLAPDDVVHPKAASIPRVIVQGWFDSELPEDAQPLVDAWRQLHPSWSHRMFDTDSAQMWLHRTMGADAIEIFRRAKPVAKANLFRYAYLAQVGGVWSDIDDRPLTAIDALVNGRALVVVRESLGAIADDFIAVQPGHPVLKAARDEAFRNERDGYSELQWLANGPAMFTRKVAGWIAGVIPDEGQPDAPGDYRVVPGTQIVRFISLHERLAYKSTSMAWDADVHRKPHRLFTAESAPAPQSARQRGLMQAETPE